MPAIVFAGISLRATAAPVTVVVDVGDRSQAIREICLKWYSRIDAFLYGPGHELPYHEIQVVAEPQRTTASAARNRVSLHPELLRRADDRELEGVLVHELTHVVENYGGLERLRCDGLRSVYCFFRVRMDFDGDRWWWIKEGIADYVRYTQFSGTLEPKLEKIGEKQRTRGYRVGYRRAASFLLLWLERTKDPAIVRKLNAAVNAHPILTAAVP